jgi:perosamine synthetase
VCLSDLERRYVLEALDEGMISSSGPHVKRFECLIAQRAGVEHAIATSSGTSALELVLRAMGIERGNEVILPALTFASPALAVALVGAIPVFADVTPDTWTIDPSHVAELLTDRTRAIIAVDVLGHPCDYDELSRFGVPIIEDAAEAHGATYRGRPVGGFGSAAIFSFHANKAVTCGEGGCVVTNDPILADAIRMLNSFGMDPARRYWHTGIGSNHRMTNLVAALALGQLERWDELIAGRRLVAERYDFALKSLPVRRRPVAAWAGESVWLYTIQTHKRENVLGCCSRNGIDARPLWPALPNNPVFTSLRSECPRAEAISSTAMWLPTWSGMPQECIDLVASSVAEAFVKELYPGVDDDRLQ